MSIRKTKYVNGEAKKKRQKYYFIDLKFQQTSRDRKRYLVDCVHSCFYHHINKFEICFYAKIDLALNSQFLPEIHFNKFCFCL